MTPQNAMTLHRPVRNFDRWLHAQFAHISGGLSLTALQLAFSDWLLHLVNNPAQLAELVQEAQQQLQTLALVTIMPSVLTTTELAALRDHRFEHPYWKQWPLIFIASHFYVRNAGGNMQRPISEAFRHTTKKSSALRLDSYWISCHQPTHPSQIQLFLSVPLKRRVPI